MRGAVIPNIVKGKGITGSIAYVMGQGNDRETGKRKKLEEGQEARARILGGQNFGFEIDSAERLEIARRDDGMERQAGQPSSSGRKCEKDCLARLAVVGERAGTRPPKKCRRRRRAFSNRLAWRRRRRFLSRMTTPRTSTFTSSPAGSIPTTGKTFSQEDDFAKGQAWSAAMGTANRADFAKRSAAAKTA